MARSVPLAPRLDLAENRLRWSQPANLRLACTVWLRQRTSPGLWVALGLLLFAAVWLTHLSSTSLSPPADNIEQLTWVHSLEWGYYKHPPLPTWLLWLPVQLFGARVWVSYATGAVVTLASMGLFWRLVSQLRGSWFATLALLAVLCISYYNGRLYYYNHNILLLLFSTASAALCWKAWTTGRLRWWAALGAVLGLGMLTKYQIGVTIVSVLVFWLTQCGWRDSRQRRGLLLAALIALLLFIPHLDWLRTHDFGPIQYAVETSLGAYLGPQERLLHISNWLADQLLSRALPAWLLLAAMLYRVRAGAALPGPLVVAAKRREQSAGRALLLSWGVAPLLLMALMGLAAGSNLQMQWGTPFLLFAVPAAMELASKRVAWSRIPLSRALKAFAVIQLSLLLLSHLTSAQGPERLRDKHWRNFDSKELARQLEAPARAALQGGPLCVISGPADLAGALALQLTDHPLVLIDGRYDRSPWVSTDLVRRCGMLQLQRHGPLPGGQPVGSMFPGVFWRVVAPKLPPAAAANTAGPSTKVLQ